MYYEHTFGRECSNVRGAVIQFDGKLIRRRRRRLSFVIYYYYAAAAAAAVRRE